MRSSRVSYFVVPMVVAVLLAPIPASALNLSPATSLVCAAGAGGFGFAQRDDDACGDLAGRADEARHDWIAAGRAADAVAAIYGLFSLEYLAAAIYAEYKEGQWEDLRDEFVDRCLNV